MQFQVLSILSASLLFISSVMTNPLGPHPEATSGAVTSANFDEQALAKAKALGVDPAGPKPDDFDSFDGKAYHFSEGSKFAAWVAAQNAPGLEKRQSGISLVAWSSTVCTGNGVLWDNIPFESQFYDGGLIGESIQVLAGVIPANELFLLTDVCTVSLAFTVNGGVGCAGPLPAFDCFDFFD